MLSQPECFQRRLICYLCGEVEHLLITGSLKDKAKQRSQNICESLMSTKAFVLE